MNPYELDDYRNIIRARTKALGQSEKGFNLKRLAQKIPIQYTYLSKALNDPKTHLSEDHLFRACQILHLAAEETDYLFLLRAHATTQDAKRRNFLQQRIVAIRRAKGSLAEVRSYRTAEYSRELAYLLDPLCILVHVSLLIPAFRDEPRQFCQQIGIELRKYREILKKLSDAGFIELEDGGGKVVRVLNSKIHYGPDHPLIRAHQAQLRMMSSARFFQLPEEARSSIMLTFTADEGTRKRIAQKLEALLKEIQQEVSRAKDEHVYQICLDLFRWA